MERAGGAGDVAVSVQTTPTMTSHPAPTTPLGVSLCLAFLLAAAPALAQETPTDSLPPEPTYEEPTAYEEVAPDDAAPDIAATLAADGRFTILLDALASTGLDVALTDDGPFTVFAPTDSAFAALPEGSLESLTADDLRTVLLYHVVEGDLAPDAADLAEPVATLAGPTLDLTELDGGLIVNGVAAAGEGVAVSNGRIYALGTVLLPPAPADTDGDL